MHAYVGGGIRTCRGLCHLFTGARQKKEAAHALEEDNKTAHAGAFLSCSPRTLRRCTRVVDCTFLFIQRGQDERQSKPCRQEIAKEELRKREGERERRCPLCIMA